MQLKRVMLILGISLLLSACRSGDFLEFKPMGNCWQLSPGQFSRLAETLSKADEDEREKLIDKVYSIADSIASANQDGTLLVFSDAMEQTFYQVTSPLRNDALYLQILERERECESLMSFDYRRIDWKSGVIRANMEGSRIADIPLYDINGSETSLHRLLDRQTVIMVYGEACEACTELMRDAVSSKALKEASEKGELRLISIYTGNDEAEFASKSAVLSGWENYIDLMQVVRYENKFDSRLVPSLYLVSDKKMVKLKGVRTVREVVENLNNPALHTRRIKLNQGEQVWGGRIADGKFMPFGEGFLTTLYSNGGNQVMPLLITTDGRYVWSEAPFDFHIEDSELVIENAIAAVETAFVGANLADAYHYGQRRFFPSDGKLPPVKFFECPQYNTWIELQYNQNQKDVLEYARGIVRNGLPVGIIMIDDTWMEDYGKWVFHPGRFPDPKAMCDELHRMGFKVMLWVCPFVSMDQYQIWAEINSFNGFVGKKGAGVYPVEWWNGISAELDYSNPQSVEWFDRQLSHLCDKYGVDGFKFDAGDFGFLPEDSRTERNLQPYEYSQAFAAFADKYPYNEYRACWRDGGKAVVQRLHDKSHNWDALRALIPEMLAANLMGYWYSCPDMIGGGSFASFLPGCVIDQDLIVRSAQTHALMPMMQFSVAPWRILDREHLNAVLESVQIRQKLMPTIMELVNRASKTGEPIVTPLEYRFPHLGYAQIKDEFLLGDEILVAPMLEKGFTRKVILPPGEWKADDGKVYAGGQTVEINVPLERIPYFTLVKN